jgi:outer membrane protein assembly factor BamB
MRRTGSALLLLLVLVCGGCFNWTQYGGTAARTSNNPRETALNASTIAGLHPVWSTPIVPNVPIATWGSRVIVGDGANMSGLDLSTGDVVWQEALGSGQTLSPVVRGGVVYISEFTYAYDGPVPINCDGALRARSTATGDRLPDEDLLLWEDGACNGPGAGSAIGSRYASIGSELRIPYSAGTYARVYDWQAGVQYDLFDDGRYRALDEAGGLLVTTRADSLTARRLADGEIVWQRDVSLSFPTSPAVSAGAVYLSTTGGTGEADHLQVIDAATGQGRWSGALPEAADPGKPAVRSGAAFVTGARQLWAFEDCGAAECAPVWTTDIGAGDVGWSEPTVAGDLVYVLARKVEGVSSGLLVFAANGCGQATCAPLATVTVDGDAVGPIGGPIVVNGKVLVQTSTGIHALSM